MEQRRLNSYLIEITAADFGYKDTDGKPLVDKILDVAGQKGTGKWTGIAALDLGIPVTLIGEAVFARCLSALKEERVEASKVYRATLHSRREDRSSMLPARSLCIQNHQLCPRVHAHAGRRGRNQMETQLWLDCAYVAGRLHHPQPLFGQNQKAYTRTKISPTSFRFLFPRRDL